ncbi:hypothetical protein HERIO_799 [Hepatospora eriocheir]|uniref:Uncharacterized protein n=1 Tax=Hepatospora eriocheir TaxID=1081669 RepID=A0A1X0QC76_9MICR|nr:hypothetical protein HERIO_799 [Hepatospora eriocheir]
MYFENSFKNFLIFSFSSIFIIFVAPREKSFKKFLIKDSFTSEEYISSNSEGDITFLLLKISELNMFSLTSIIRIIRHLYKLYSQIILSKKIFIDKKSI